MSRFLTDYDVRWLREWEADRQLRKFLAKLMFQSDELGGEIVDAPAGLVIDGQSIPREVAGFVGHQDEDAGGIHDWLYLSHRLRMGALSVEDFIAYVRYVEAGGPTLPEIEAEIGPVISQATADLIYREILLLNGMHEVHAQQQYAALDYYGTTPYATGPQRLRIEPVSLSKGDLP